MSGSHEKLPRLFWVQVVLVLVVAMLYLFAPSPQSHAQEDSPEVLKMKEALQPVGSVVVKKAMPVVVARSGKVLVEKTCAVCHSIGLANAPKLDGTAKVDWESRLAGGMRALVQSAIAGKGGMPPRGGDPSITDAEMQDAVVHMLSLAEVNVADAIKEPTAEVPVVAAVAAVAASAEPAKQMQEVTKAPVMDEVLGVDAVQITQLGEATYNDACLACHGTGVANAPIVGSKLAWQKRLASGLSVLYHTALKGDQQKAAMPAKGGNPSLSDAAVREAVDYMVVKSR